MSLKGGNIFTHITNCNYYAQSCFEIGQLERSLRYMPGSSILNIRIMGDSGDHITFPLPNDQVKNAHCSDEGCIAVGWFP